MKGREIYVVHLRLRNIGGIVVAATFGRSVTREMLHARQNMIGRANVIALEAANLCSGDRRPEIRIFARPFHNATPAWVASNVQHRRKCPTDADRPRFYRRDALRRGYRRGIPGSGHRNRHWKDGAKAVDHIEAENQRNMHTSFVDRKVLEAVDFSRVGDEEQRSRMPTGYGLVDFLHFAKIKKLAELPDLFLQRHLFEERINALANNPVIGSWTRRTLAEGEWSDREGYRHRADKKFLSKSFRADTRLLAHSSLRRQTWGMAMRKTSGDTIRKREKRKLDYLASSRLHDGCSFVAQRYQRIDARRASRRDVACQERNEDKKDGNGGKRLKILRRHAKQQAPHQRRQSQSGGDSNHHAHQRQSCALS